VDREKIEQALDGLDAREVRELYRLAEKRLQTCVLCGSDGANAIRIFWKAGRDGKQAALLLCPACIERHRLPAGEGKEAEASAS